MAGRKKRRVNAALKKLLRNISTLHEDEENARFHDDESTTALQASLREFGQQKPIVALDDGKVIAGNGTLRAAKALGWKQLAVVTFPDEESARAYAIVDNRTAEMSDWNQEELMSQIEELGDEHGMPDMNWDELVSDGVIAPMKEGQGQVTDLVDIATVRLVMSEEDTMVVQEALRIARKEVGDDGDPKIPWSAAVNHIASWYIQEQAS